MTPMATRLTIAAAFVAIGAGMGALALSLAGSNEGFAELEGDVRVIRWMDLMPEGARDPALALQGLVEHGALPPLPSEQAQMSAPAAVDTSLDGQTVALAGYMTPLFFDEAETDAFLLVPYVGACIHVPAPPPNQIVFVESETPVPVLEMWEPFRAIGTLHVRTQSTDLAQSAYTMTLERMEAFEEAAVME